MYCIINNKLDQGSSILQSELLKQLTGLGRQQKISEVCPISMHFTFTAPLQPSCGVHKPCQVRELFSLCCTSTAQGHSQSQQQPHQLKLTSTWKPYLMPQPKASPDGVKICFTWKMKVFAGIHHAAEGDSSGHQPMAHPSNLSSPLTGRTSLNGRRPEVSAGGWSTEHSCKAGLGKRWSDGWGQQVLLALDARCLQVQSRWGSMDGRGVRAGDN